MIAAVAWRQWASLLVQDVDLQRVGQIVGDRAGPRVEGDLATAISIELFGSA
jgi:hypothetical protein